MGALKTLAGGVGAAVRWPAGQLRLLRKGKSLPIVQTDGRQLVET